MTNKQLLRSIYIVAFVQTLSIAAADSILPVYLKALGASEFLVGIAFAWFSLVRGITSLSSGPLVDWLGRRTLLGFSQAGFALANLAYALVQSPGQLAACRLVQGLAAGLYWVVILSMVANASAPADRLRNLTLFNISVALSGMVGNWIAGFQAEYFSPSFVFLQSCIMFASISLFIFRFFPEEQAPDHQQPTGRFSFSALLHISKQVKLISLLAGVGMIAETVTKMGMPLYVHGVGGSYRDVGLIAGLIVGCGLLSQFFAPKLQERLGNRGIILLVYVSNALFLLVLFWQKTLKLAYFLFPLIGALFALTNLTWLASAQNAAAAGQMGAATGFFRGTLDLTNVAYYLAFGALSARFTVVPLLAVAAFVLVALAVTAQQVELEHSSGSGQQKGFSVAKGGR
ncbi:MAG: MFS transporter [Firmicutes bacterium]|nr:MFS transporter [Bacillota bacterium]